MYDAQLDTMIRFALNDIKEGLFVEAGRDLASAWDYVEHHLCHSNKREEHRALLKAATNSILEQASKAGKWYISSSLSIHTGQIEVAKPSKDEVVEMLNLWPEIIIHKFYDACSESDLKDIYNVIRHAVYSIESLNLDTSKRNLVKEFYEALSVPFQILNQQQLDRLLSFNEVDVSLNNTIISIARNCSAVNNATKFILDSVEELLGASIDCAKKDNFATAALIMNSAWSTFLHLDIYTQFQQCSRIYCVADELFTLAKTPLRRWELLDDMSGWNARLPVPILVASDIEKEMVDRIAFVEDSVLQNSGNGAVLALLKLKRALDHINERSMLYYQTLSSYRDKIDAMLFRLRSNNEVPTIATIRVVSSKI